MLGFVRTRAGSFGDVWSFSCFAYCVFCCMHVCCTYHWPEDSKLSITVLGFVRTRAGSFGDVWSFSCLAYCVCSVVCMFVVPITGQRIQSLVKLSGHLHCSSTTFFDQAQAKFDLTNTKIVLCMKIKVCH